MIANKVNEVGIFKIQLVNVFGYLTKMKMSSDIFYLYLG